MAATQRCRPDFTRMDLNARPFLVILEVTQACHLACRHCRAAAQPVPDPRQFSFAEGQRIIDQIAASGDPPPTLVLTGGDPLMRPDLFDLIAYAVSLGLRVSLTPSATPLVTKGVMRRARDAGLSRWAFSLDGSRAEIHDAFRGVQGSYELTIRAIDYLHELGLPVQLNTTVTRHNRHDLDNLAELAERLGVVLWSVFFLVPTGRGSMRDVISPQEHEEVFNWLYDLSQRVGFDIKTTAAQHYRRVVLQRSAALAERDSANVRARPKNNGNGAQLDNGRARRPRDGISRMPVGINDGNGCVFISHTGEVYPSGFLPVSAGNVLTRPFLEIYQQSPLFRALRDPERYRGKCGWCEFRYICGGSRARAYAVTGDYLESEPFCVYVPDPRRAEEARTRSFEPEHPFALDRV